MSVKIVTNAKTDKNVLALDTNAAIGVRIKVRVRVGLRVRGKV